MTRKCKVLILPITLMLNAIHLLNLQSYAGVTNAADIYCVMRQGGNDHDTSWLAAYTNLKKQRSGIFKISPRQAANVIVETVVSDSSKYKECLPFLGDLYRSKLTPAPKDSLESMTTDPEILNYSPSNTYEDDRYSY